MAQIAIRTVAVAATFAVLAAAAAGAARAPIPWIDVPLPLWHYPPPKQIPYPASARPCKASQLAVSAGRHGAATGHLLEELVFTNTGRRSCLLRGYPSIRATGKDGKRVLLHPRHGTFFGQLTAADAKPGGHVVLDIETDDACDNGLRKPAAYRDLVFTLASGGDVPGSKIELRVVCGLAISKFGLQARYTGSAPPAAASVGSLQVRITAPASVRRGAILHYTVTLTNPTNRTVSFKVTNCPGYTQGLYTPAAQVRGSYRLNCRALDALTPKATSTFAMRLRVPKHASLELAKLGWNLDTEYGPSAGSVVRVNR